VAKREKIPEIILPLSNKYDVEGLPSDITSGLKFHFVDTYSDVFEIVFE
jgi:ATP-dependent Lon protease